MNPANGTTTIVAGATILQAHDLVLSFGETQPFAERTSRWKGRNRCVMGRVDQVVDTAALPGRILVRTPVRSNSMVNDWIPARRERSRLRRDRFGFVFQFGQLVQSSRRGERCSAFAAWWMHRGEASVKPQLVRTARPRGLERQRAGEMSGGQSNGGFSSWLVAILTCSSLTNRQGHSTR